MFVSLERYCFLEDSCYVLHICNPQSRWLLGSGKALKEQCTFPGGWKAERSHWAANLNFHGIDATSKKFSPFSWEVFHHSPAHKCCDLTKILHEFAFWIHLWHLEFGVLGKRHAAGEWISSTAAVKKIGSCLLRGQERNILGSNLSWYCWEGNIAWQICCDSWRCARAQNRKGKDCC